jgi:hypothetical protein
MAKTWKQKLEDKKEPKLQTLQKAMSGVPAGGTLLMPTAQSVKAFMDQIPSGQQVSFQQMRQQLAEAHQADLSCPMSTSMVARIVAEAAWEDIEAGKAPTEVTPFWRVIEPDSSLAKKLGCGTEFIQSMRQQEGIAS